MVLSMKIDSNLSNPWLDSIGRAAEDTTPGSKQAEKNSAQVEFPQDRFTPSQAPTDQSHAEKVAALQNAVNDGTYSVSAEDIADAILREWNA